MSKIYEKYWDLSSGIRVEENHLDKVTSIDDALELVKRSASTFAFLSYEARNNSDVLYAALKNYPKPTTKFGFKGELCYGMANPICYAENDAITRENINLAIRLGNIKFDKMNAISKHKAFIMACFSSIYSNEEILPELLNIATELKADPDIAALFQERGINVLYKNTAMEKATNYSESIMAVLPNGDFIQNQSSSNLETSGKNKPSLNKIIKYFRLRYPKNLALANLNKELLTSKLIKVQSQICSKNGVLVIRVNGKDCSIDIPRPMTREQFNILLNLLVEDLRTKAFNLSIDGQDFYEQGVSSKLERLYIIDVFRLLKEKGLMITDEPYVFEQSSTEEVTL